MTSVPSLSQLSEETLKKLPRPGNDFDIHEGKLLAPILRTRIPGTPGSIAVLNHFNDFFKQTLPDWTVEFQNSSARTPISGNKEVPFVNFIASRDPPWASKGDVGRLTLVAHYDSKYEPKGFIGAIDSAAPCAMIMHAMRSIDAALTRKWDDMQAKGDGLDSGLDAHTGIQVLFLDGEEAFKTWTDSDSLYGSRSLAETWDETTHSAMSIFRTPLSSISLFMLLDLLGSKDPTIQSYFPTTHWAYQNLASLEGRLRNLKQFKSSPNYDIKSGHVDEPQWLVDAEKSEHLLKSWTAIQDDHVPFMRRGVDVLHIIDTPGRANFPTVWHTIHDDGEHLDLPTVEDWSMLITAFAAEWMELEGYFDAQDAAEKMYIRKTEL
ncbi:glutaminyl cyclase, putative [Talaromyces stipitatus ATCC 10500]|uniref:Peptide hydrolase n=1 Tax=Talaromyces stipitatus (strain ATCC 10500 / CBS 375.48 / QM 6759 / NRRL 1006) TaxID=441959 RepID=B8M896_TALSN|nr:glutaminyl cyclase, putative [Talaromyces stipitatus ATCC 10500]EED20409.1 glutaminyl cyclase, putative [Talaromyces stipitatus ATCC 10500]